MAVGVDGHADESPRELHDPRVGDCRLTEFSAPAAPGRAKLDEHR